MPQGTKVMTKAEFENYKKSAASRDQDEGSNHSEDNYDDDDDVERQRQLAKQRRKQEAHLSVYRQQMMKVTGQQPDDPPSGATGRSTESRSTLSLPSLSSLGTLDPGGSQAVTPTKTSDDEDDEIPLGVLQAHGFPSKSRPPTRLANASTSSVPQIDNQMPTYPTPAGATRNDLAAGGGGNTDLPPFARGLPRDPYVGASIVNQPVRNSLGSTYGGTQPTSYPPGGLVGVIAGEERAKAMRRGSPNVNGTYGPMGLQQSQMIPQMGQMQYPGMQMGMPFLSPHPRQITPSEQSQMEMNAQMTQMMQMQMQWMQQMMQMQGLQMPPMPGMNPMQSEQPQYRDSMQSAVSSSNEYQQGHQRAASVMSQTPHPYRTSSQMSGLHPSYTSGNSGGLGPGYAPSIAPSERSNVGQPSRYRSVTPANPIQDVSLARDSRNSTMSDTPGAASTINRPRSRSPHKLDLPMGVGQGLGAVVNPPATIRAINKPKKGTGGGSDDEEDDAAWADMRKRREERRSRWTARKKEKESAEMPKEGLEGLYYEG